MAIRVLFDPLDKLPSWALKLLCLVPLIPLFWQTDLTALLWLGSTAAILLTSKSARAAVFQMVYKTLLKSVIIGVVLGTLVGLVLGPWVDAFAEYATGAQIDLSQFANVHGDAGAFMELLLVAIIFGGIIEEVAFRGFFIGWGARLFGMKWAIPLLLMSSAAFAIGHLYQSPAGGLSSGLFALFVGTVYLLLERKLLPVIILHAVSNFWGVLDLYQNGV